MAVVKKYNVFCCGELIGEYTAVDAARKLGCSAGLFVCTRIVVENSVVNILLKKLDRHQNGKEITR